MSPSCHPVDSIEALKWPRGSFISLCSRIVHHSGVVEHFDLRNYSLVNLLVRLFRLSKTSSHKPQRCFADMAYLATKQKQKQTDNGHGWKPAAVEQSW